MKISGAKLKRIREHEGRSRTSLSEVVDVTYVRIWQIEQLETKGSNMNANSVKAIAKFLNCKVDDLKFT